jgi:hypothetical protein
MGKHKKMKTTEYFKTLLDTHSSNSTKRVLTVLSLLIIINKFQ